MITHIDLQVDACGMCCPLPLIQLARAVKSLKSGQTLEISGNDPIFESCVHDFCRSNGHAVLETTTGSNGRVTVWIKVDNAS